MATDIYIEKCALCHENGLAEDAHCRWYGDPDGCNHPNRGIMAGKETVADVLEAAKGVIVWDLPGGPMRYLRRMTEAHDREVTRLRDALETLMDAVGPFLDSFSAECLPQEELAPMCKALAKAITVRDAQEGGAK